LEISRHTAKGTSLQDAKCTSCGRGESSELTPTASAASLGYVGLQAARRNTRFARYCEENTLADATILTTNFLYTIISKPTISLILIKIAIIFFMQFHFKKVLLY